MPGIFAIFSRSKPPRECQSDAHAMLASMMHEPFYVSGTFSMPDLGVHCGWVAQESTFAASVSGFHEETGVALIFAGECFSDDPHAAEIPNKNAPATPRSGNWIVRLYLEQGERCIESLNGLFSGLLIDRNRRCAFIFNDRYGIERVYYHETKAATYFASEAKALLRILPELRAFDEKGVAQFLAFGCTLEWQTLFRGVGLLPGGSCWCYKHSSEWRKGRYFVPENWSSQPTLTPNEFEAAFDFTFRRILKRYVGSGAGLGISLTGGLDTRMIMACRPQTKELPICYTFSGRRERTLDASIAARIASICGLEHHVLRIGDDFLKSYGDYVDRTVLATDGSSGATGAHEIYFNQLARELARIRLTGNFGSEILRGMSTFKPMRLADELLESGIRRSVAEAAEYVPASIPHPVTFAAFREIPWNLFGTLAAGRSQVTFRTPYLDNELVALAFQSAQGLRESPASALRFIQNASPALSKVPTDRGLNRDGRGAAVFFRHLFCEFTFKLEYLYNDGPPEWLSRMDPVIWRLGAMTVAGLHKYLPYRHWYRNELADYVSGSVAEALRRQSAFWNPAFLRNMAAEHVSGRRNWVREINMVLTLDAVDRLLLRGWARNGEPTRTPTSHVPACSL